MFDDDVATVLRRIGYHLVAQALGAEGLLIETPDQVAVVLRRAKELYAAGRPVLINAHIGASDFRKGSISM